MDFCHNWDLQVHKDLKLSTKASLDTLMAFCPNLYGGLLTCMPLEIYIFFISKILIFLQYDLFSWGSAINLFQSVWYHCEAEIFPFLILMT